MPARTKSKTVLKKEQELVLFFQIQERKLNAAVDKMSRKAIRQDGATPAMLKNYREQVREILDEMQTKSADLGQALVRSAYGEGVEIADAALKANGISVIANPGMIHVQTAKVMAEAITNRFGDVTGAIGRRVDDIFRTVQLEMASASAMGYEGVKEAARNIRDELLDRGIGFFKDSAGKLWNLETYAEMAAITVTTEARNRGTWNEFAEHGEDLVIVSIHPMSCPKCEPWQGVVLSLSGNTPGYPTIHDAMADGLFHPRCRHSTVLYIPDDFTGILITKVSPEEEEPPKEEKAIRGVSVAKIDSLRGERPHIEDDLTPAEGASRIRNDYLHVGIEIDRKEAAAIRKAIWDYSGLEYGSMREAIFKEMKGSKLTPFEQTLVEKFRRVEEYTKIAPRYTNEEGTIYRGIKDTGSQYSKMLNGLKPGDKIDLQKGASFSSRPVKAGSFAKDGGYLLEIKDNSWKNAVSIRPFARTSLEDEVLVSDRRWIVTGVTKNKDGLKVITITRDSK